MFLFYFITFLDDISSERAPGRGEHGNVSPPPEIGKNWCSNLMLFSKAVFIATTFPDLVGKSFFYWLFFKNFQNFLKIFSTICVFRPIARNMNAWFLNNVAKYENNAFFSFLSTKHWKIVKLFENLSTNSDTLCLSSNRAKIGRMVFNQSCKNAKIMRFCNFITTFCKISQKFLKISRNLLKVFSLFSDLLCFWRSRGKI